MLPVDQACSERAARFAARVADISEYLAREPLRGPLGRVARTVTYHDPCHVVHGQKIRSEPRALLAQIPGLTVVELPEADWCCGSAGTYNLTQPEMAGRLQARKIANIEATRAGAVVTANPGCIIQIAQGLGARGRQVEVLHIVDLLDQAYRSAAPAAGPSETSPARTP
jgi:glycolate oxidase iron-sulfur subunit